MIEHDPSHPIIDRPNEYRILSLRYDTGSEAGEPFIDLHLGRGTIVRKLRFWSPEEGFPEPTHGMMILDVRARQMDGLGVQVADVEASWGAITFWARDVVDLDTMEATNECNSRSKWAGFACKCITACECHTTMVGYSHANRLH